MNFESLTPLLQSFEKEILCKIVPKSFGKHNHPPMIGINQTCKFCLIHGNVFKDGSISKQHGHEEIKKIMKCM